MLIGLALRPEDGRRTAPVPNLGRVVSAKGEGGENKSLGDKGRGTGSREHGWREHGSRGHGREDKGRDDNVRRTDSGIEVGPVYRPDDLEGWDPERRAG